MLARRLTAGLLLSTALLAQGAGAQDMIGFPREDFGKVVLSQRQVAGAIPEAALGAYANEPISNYGSRSYLYQLGRPVGRLDVLTNVRVFPCTAFLVSPKYVMTNYHCVPGVTELPEARLIGVKRIEAVQLKLGYTRQGVEEGAKSFTVSPTPVEADKGLDYAILEVFGDPAAEFGQTRLAALQPTEKSPLIIIGHPQGWAQYVSLLRCRSDDPAVSAGRLRHTCDTLPGNSGSPVFDADTRTAIALHHAGSQAQSINYAVPLTDIVAKSKLLQQIVRDQQGVPAAKAAEPKVLPKAVDQVVDLAPPSAPPPARCSGVEVEVVGTGKTCLYPADAAKREFADCAGSGGGRVCGPQMVVVPAGRFLMGSPASEKDRDADEGPQHEVTIPRPFAVGKFEVTFAEWDACVAEGECKHKPGDEGWGRAKRPVINVSWNDVTGEYLPWLNRKLGLSGAGAYRLLTEAEWEYAARAGATTAFSTGPMITTEQANFDGNYTYAGSAKGVYRQKTVDVGTFKANAFGLHDMHGNVWEWVQDCYVDSYKNAPKEGSKAVESKDCQFRVVRGGSWNLNPGLLRAALRDRYTTDIRGLNLGFRVGRVLAR